MAEYVPHCFGAWCKYSTTIQLISPFKHVTREIGDVCKIRLVFTQISKNNIVNHCKSTVGPAKVETSFPGENLLRIFKDLQRSSLIKTFEDPYEDHNNNTKSLYQAISNKVITNYYLTF